MRLICMIALGCVLAGCGPAPTEPDQNAAPVEVAVPVAAVLETSPDTEWRTVEADNLMLIKTEHGEIAIELNSDFAPVHAARMRELAEAGAYNGEAFYRVIDGFVAQGGLEDETLIAEWEPLANENDRDISDATFNPLGNADLFTKDVGHINGFAVSRDAEMGREWLLHCPGAVAMARDEDPDTGGTEFYIVLDAQRYLDRNLTVFGRVIDGMEHVQALKRGDRAIESGVIQAPDKGDTMLSVKMAETPRYRVMNTSHQAFEDFKTSKRVREEAFFYRKPPEVLDICSVEVPVERME